MADLSAHPKVWSDICSNDLEPVFWELVRQQLGYSDAQPNLRGLLISILVTDFCRSLLGDAPRQLAHFVLPERSLAANASVFVSRWRSDIAQFSSYNALAQAVASELDLTPLLGSLSAEQLIECMTFEEIELRIVQDLKKRIVDGGGANMDVVRGHIARRRDGHWANPLLASANDRTKALAACYDALTAAADFFSLKALHAGGFNRVISDKPPKEYLAFFAAKSGEEGFSVQEIPLDPELLDTPAYKKFLEVRRERIANRLNLFISG